MKFGNFTVGVRESQITALNKVQASSRNLFGLRTHLWHDCDAFIGHPFRAVHRTFPGAAKAQQMKLFPAVHLMCEHVFVQIGDGCWVAGCQAGTCRIQIWEVSGGGGAAEAAGSS